MTDEVKTVEADAAKAVSTVTAAAATVKADVATAKADVAAADSKAVAWVKAHAGAIVTGVAVVAALIVWHLL